MPTTTATAVAQPLPSKYTIPASWNAELAKIEYRTDKGKVYAPSWAYPDKGFQFAPSFEAARDLAFNRSVDNKGQAQAILQGEKGAFFVTGLRGLTADPNSREVAYGFNHKLEGFRTSGFFGIGKKTYNVTSVTPSVSDLAAIVGSKSWINFADDKPSVKSLTN